MLPKATTKLYGLIGTPIDHSFSPSMHNKAFETLDIDGCYLAFDTDKEDLEKTVAALKQLGARGWNVTMPLKSEIVNYCDYLSPEAKLIGAVNTVVNDNGILTGYSTDGIGFFRNAKENDVIVKDKNILLLGAGGAARSIAAQAVLEDVKKLTIYNRTLEKALELKEDLSEEAKKRGVMIEAKALEDKESLRKDLLDSDLFINATSVGMSPDDKESIIEEADIPDNIVVADIVYTPNKTQLEKIAEKKNLKILDGLGMVLWQGAYAFNLWTQADFPVELIKKEVFKIDTK